MRIDYDRVREVLDANPPLNDCAGYYRQYDCRQEWLGPLVPRFQDLLRQAFSPSMHVLDVGCGRGDTLLDNASRFGWGTGIDESERVMIAAANRAKAERGIRNVDFRVAKAAALPLADASVDLVFAERGPIGCVDATSQEALRVLRPGGLMLVETLGEQNGWEMRHAFDPEFQRPLTALGSIDAVRCRFERQGVRVQVLASYIGIIRFPDFYEWLKYQCYTWNYPPREMLSCERREAYERFAAIAADEQGRIGITRHTIWIGGSKAG